MSEFWAMVQDPSWPQAIIAVALIAGVCFVVWSVVRS